MYEIYTLDFYKGHEALTKETDGILWGSYEDIKFSPINDYSSVEKLFQISENNIFERVASPEDKNDEMEWNTDSPSSMIVLYSKKENFIAEDVELWRKDTFKSKEFLSILLVSCDNSQSKKIGDLVDSIQEYSSNSHIPCSCFGTFGMYNLCVLIRTENINDIFSFVFELQKKALEAKICIKTSYTLVCYLGTEREYLEECNNDCENDEYVANIQITYADWSCGNAILSKFQEAYGDEFKNIRKYNVLGEYDLCLHIPAKKLLLRLYRENGLLCSDGDFYKKYIQHCCTRLAKVASITENLNTSSEDNISENNALSVRNPNTEIDDELKKALVSLANNKFFKNNKAFKRLFHILNIDFNKAYKLKADEQLKDDLKYQFLSIVRSMDEAVGNISTFEADDKIDFDFYEIANSLAHLFSKAVRNVIFTDELTINEPYTYLDTAALFPNVVYAYTGFIKKLLILIYSNGGYKQSEIIPIIYIDSSINVLRSDIYMLETDLSALKNNDKTRIIAFKLPLDAVLNFELYIPLLIHEIGHYLCPYNRDLRNKYLFKLVVKHYFSTMLYQIYNDLIIDEKIKEAIKTENIRKSVCEWVDDEIIDFVKEIDKNCPDFFVYTSTYFIDFVCGSFDSIFSKYKTEYSDDFVGEKICKFFVRMINNWIGSVCENNKIEYKDCFQITEETLQKTIIIKGKNSSCCNEVRAFSNGIREVVCDMMMIQCLSLQPVSYYSLIIISMLEQNISSCEDVISIVRLGHIVDYYNSFSDGDFEITCHENEILNTIYHLNRKCYETKFEQIHSIIQQIGEAIKKYDDFYSYFKSDIISLTDCYNILAFNKFSKTIKNNAFIVEDLNALGSIFEKILSSFENYINKPICDCVQNKDFDVKNNIEIMNDLQSQLSLKYIGDFYKEAKTEKGKSPKRKLSTQTNFKNLDESLKYNRSLMKTEIRISEGNDIEHAISIMQTILTDNEHPEEILWYRGQNNADWAVSPAIFRKDSVNFHRKLLRAYELFRAEACEALEIHTNINSNADWIACMQHYLVPTHFLDWSEQPLTSLYFALENYFVNPCLYCNESVPDCDNEQKNLCLCGSAALFVLNPYRMNRFLKNIDNVPNISIPHNELKYSDYILNYNFESDDRILIESAVDLIKCPPIAIITSQLNSRIRAQKGHFVAYDLRMDFNGSSGSNLVNLYELQRQYFLQCMSKGKEFKPFIGKIIIDYNMRAKLAHTLKAYGINKSSFYPELKNIGTDIAKKIFS